MHRILQQPGAIGELTKKMSRKLFQLLILFILIASFLPTTSPSIPHGNSNRIIAGDDSSGISLPHDDGADQAWEDYQNKFKGSIYLDGSDKRKEIFYKAHQRIVEHNKGNHPYRKGYNQFTVMTKEEREKYLGYRFP